MPWLNQTLRHPSAILLFVQLLGVLLYPWMEQAAAGRAWFGLFGVLVLGVALRMVQRSPAVTWIAGALAALIAALTVVHYYSPNTTVFLIYSTLEAMFYFYAAASLIAYMLQDDHASTDELFAAGATFTLLA